MGAAGGSTPSGALALPWRVRGWRQARCVWSLSHPCHVFCIPRPIFCNHTLEMVEDGRAKGREGDRHLIKKFCARAFGSVCDGGSTDVVFLRCWRSYYLFLRWRKSDGRGKKEGCTGVDSTPAFWLHIPPEFLLSAAEISYPLSLPLLRSLTLSRHHPPPPPPPAQAFAKDFLQCHGIPMAKYRNFDREAHACSAGSQEGTQRRRGL